MHVDVVIVERRSFRLLQQYSWLMTVIYVRNADAGYSSGRGSEAGWHSVAQKSRARKLLQMTEEWLNKTQVSEIEDPTR